MKRLLPFGLAALFLALAAVSGRQIEDRRAAAGIPVSRARVPLGGFEPLAVDLLWMRASGLVEQGRLPEAVAAYRVITELEPHVAPAWALPAVFLAWREANTGNPDREWRWVEQAIGFLRRGLAYNPDDPGLLLALGTIYYRRIVREEEIYPVAERKLGRPPEELAIGIYSALRRIAPRVLPGPLADSLVRLGDRRLAAGDEKGALARYERALPLWREIAQREPGGDAAAIADSLAAKIRDLKRR